MAGLVDKVRGRGRGGIDDAGRAALATVLTDPIFELLPLKSIADQVPHLPAGARVSVTASPAKGIDATLDWAARLQADGFRAIPHLSARMIASRPTPRRSSTPALRKLKRTRLPPDHWNW